MPATTLTPADLDRAAARLAPAPLRPAEVEAWRGITADYQRTAPAAPAARQLLTKTVAELVAEAESNLRPDHGTRPAVEIRMPGRRSPTTSATAADAVACAARSARPSGSASAPTMPQSSPQGTFSVSSATSTAGPI